MHIKQKQTLNCDANDDAADDDKNCSNNNGKENIDYRTKGDRLYWWRWRRYDEYDDDDDGDDEYDDDDDSNDEKTDEEVRHSFGMTSVRDSVVRQ